MDSVINDLLAHHPPGDLIMDAGNSCFKGADVRLRNLTHSKADIAFGPGFTAAQLISGSSINS